MGHSNANLAALIGSRICHDLISPIGAITNGLELLDMTGVTGGPELELISDSVGHAGARIRFFRIAYGAAGDQSLGQPEIVSVLSDLSRGGRVRYVWAPTDPQPRGDVRLAFLALQCCESALPYGGEVQIDRERDGWSVSGTGEAVKIDEPLWRGMTGGLVGAEAEADTDMNADMGRIGPATVQFALLPCLADDAGRRLQAEWCENRVTLRF